MGVTPLPPSRSDSGGMHMGTLGTILTFAGGIGALIFAIQILILAFKTSTGWGLASLLIPFAIFVYVAKNWPACKTPFLRWLVCAVVAGVGGAVTAYGAFSGAMAQ
ncbi:MAG: hypothetical protein ABI639_14270 [Thermoanaerobaculia bacterium]